MELREVYLLGAAYSPFVETETISAFVGPLVMDIPEFERESTERRKFYRWFPVHDWLQYMGISWPFETSQEKTKGILEFPLFFPHWRSDHIVDGRPCPPPSSSITVSLYSYQHELISRCLQKLHESGGVMLQAPCGAGKTRMLLAMASQLNLPTAILTHRRGIMTRWKKEIETHCPTQQIDVFMLQTLVKKQKNREFWNHMHQTYRVLMVDEAHHFCAPTYFQLRSEFWCTYSIGCSATPFRKDGLWDICEWALGPLVQLSKDTPLRRQWNEIHVTRLHFHHEPRESPQKKDMWCYSRFQTWLSRHKRRNRLMAQFLLRFQQQFPERRCIAFVHRVSHAREMARSLGKCVLRKEEPEEDCPVSWTTYSNIGEGLDYPWLDTEFRASPTSEMAQSLGRILRDHPLDPWVLEVVDHFPEPACCKYVFMLQAISHKCLRYYQNELKLMVEEKTLE